MISFSYFSFAEDEGNLLFKPLTASTFEPRISMFYQTQPNKMRLDIGASFDMANLYESSKIKVNTGIDFFTYTRLRSEGKMKFPVETTDFFFGINFSGRILGDNISLTSRLRIAHISSHLSDGYSDYREFFKDAFVYSLEFIDLVLAYNVISPQNAKTRFYGGFNYTFSKIPAVLPTYTYQSGLDTDFSLSKRISLMSGIDFKYFDVDDKQTNYSINFEIGPKINLSRNRSIFLYTNYYAGRSIHGLFFEEKVEYFAVGFKIIYY